MNLYVTADAVGRANHGGGQVTARESGALSMLGETMILDRGELSKVGTMDGEPWVWDHAASVAHDWFVNPTELAHFYAGTFTKTVEQLKHNGAKVSYTAAAHSIQESRDEHERLGVPFDYPHLTEPDLWERYVGGYRAADVVVCPSGVSAAAMRAHGCERVAVIPHGVSLRLGVARLPARFTVGYLGACGAPDKGLIYLLQAWKRLNYPDAVLRIGGVDSTSDWVRHLVRTHGGGSIELLGWVPDADDFYDSISLYVQPSVTEGFGIEVLEALAAGRYVVGSDGAGASEHLPYSHRFKPRDVDGLVTALEHGRWSMARTPEAWVEFGRSVAERLSWDKVSELYVTLWKGMLR